MKIIRAHHLGMCFGVRDAIQLARQTAESKPLTVFGDLVHNPEVLRSLEHQGVQFQNQTQHLQTPTVMVTAHGASERVMEEIRRRGHNVIEATCPLVQVAHQAAKRLVADGFHLVVIGKRDHVEVRGLTGDFAEFDVVLSEDDIHHLAPRARFGVVAQTTQPIDRVRFLTDVLRRGFPDSEVRFIDTVCLPTKQRQYAATQLARQSDLVIVVGGARSNNTRELAETCRTHCPRVFHIQTVRDLRREWFADVETVGLTAGTSTPDSIIQEVESWLIAVASRARTQEQVV